MSFRLPCSSNARQMDTGFWQERFSTFLLAAPMEGMNHVPSRHKKTPRGSNSGLKKLEMRAVGNRFRTFWKDLKVLFDSLLVDNHSIMNILQAFSCYKD